MKYQQPYGISDPNASYINGNPATGTMGSIPPAAAIEYDMREIVEVINWANTHGFKDSTGTPCAPPADTDLTQLRKAIFGMIQDQVPLPILHAPRDVYVNVNTGSDTLYDGTSATVSGSSGPWKTIKKACQASTAYNLGGWTFNTHIADGVYSDTVPLNLPAQNGSGGLNFIGNVTNPSAVQVFNTGTGSACVGAGAGTNYGIQGMSFRSTAAAVGDQGDGLWFYGGCGGQVNDVTFNQVAGNHLKVGPGGTIIIIGGTHRISGNAGGSGYYSNNNGILIPSSVRPSLIITNAVSIAGAFAYAQNGAQLGMNWNSITGAANVTGQKYFATTNGVIDTQTGGNVNYLPGSSAGSTTLGGQYT